MSQQWCKYAKTGRGAIVVIADEQKQDVWIEDCSVALGYMHLAASTLNLGSCWVQVRLRAAADGRSCEEFLREALGFPPNFKAEAILALGVPQRSPSPHDLQKLNLSKSTKRNFNAYEVSKLNSNLRVSTRQNASFRTLSA